MQVIKDKLPRAKIIWASITPVTVQGKPAELDPEINPIVIEQNRVAAKVMAELHVLVNNFYTLLVDKRELARGDRFHWTATAYRLLSQATVAAVTRALQSPRATEQK